jgi:protein N-terminal amidase
MDLNPRSSWTIDGGPYEVADHCLKTGSGLLILLNAWLDSEEERDREEDISTLNYWAMLLRPLWYRMDDGSKAEDADAPERLEDVETAVVVCNRSGVENGEQSLIDITVLKDALNVTSPVGATFAGSSALFHFRQSYKEPVLLEHMSRRQEGVRVWTA